MSRELRLGFAMGGGVSLGTFNGAALTEAIKLCLLYGRYKDEHGRLQPYDRVVIDVFSGASAGAMSLGIMFRSLAAPDPSRRKDAEAALAAQFGTDFTKLKDKDPDRYKDLIAAQICQDVQEEIWCRDVTLRKLLGKEPGRERDIRYDAGILDRRAVDDIAARHLRFGGPPDFKGRRLLADRTLFCCTLSNLSPVVADARQERPSAEKGFIGLKEGMSSFVHREARVFDLSFVPIPNVQDLDNEPDWPTRWSRAHVGPTSAGRIASLMDVDPNTNESRVWSKIAATSIASGAFPFGFEPVVLMRSSYEFGKDRWPEQFGERYNPQTKEYAKYPFTYVDGGAFNNEPIREAFRLASFIDSQPAGPDGMAASWDFDRRIIFVDPNVSAAEPSMRIPIHREFALDDPSFLDRIAGTKLVELSSLDRLVPHFGTVIGAIMNEARGIEADKVSGVRDKFATRDTLRAVLKALKLDASAKAFREFKDFCDKQLKAIKEGDEMPATGVSLRGELIRVIGEDTRSKKPGEFNDTLASGASDAGDIAKAVDDFLNGPMDETIPDAPEWFRALLYVVIDLSMGLTAKWRDAMLICIFPAANIRSKQPDIIELPGGRIEGFAGFMSLVNRAWEVKVARSCAREFLVAAGLVVSDAPDAAVPDLTAGEWAAFERDVADGTKLLGQRVGGLVKESNLISIFPGLDSIIEGFVASFLERKVRGLTKPSRPSKRFEFRIMVESSSYELDAELRMFEADGQPIQIVPGGPWTLVSFAEWGPRIEPKTGRTADAWSGQHVKQGANGEAYFSVDSGLFDSTFCEIELPSTETIENADLMPNPVYVARITQSDKGKGRLKSDRWNVPAATSPALNPVRGIKAGDAQMGVTALENVLFRR